MGSDKALLPWGSDTLLGHIEDRLGRIVPRVVVVGRKDIPDRVPGRGPVEGIRTAIGTSETDQNLVVAVDLPFLDTGLLELMLRWLAERDARLVVCEVAGQIPLCLAIRREALPEIEQYVDHGGRSLAGLAASMDSVTIPEEEIRLFGPPERVFRNLNTPKDYEEALADAFGPKTESPS